MTAPALDELRAVAALHHAARARTQRSADQFAALARSAYAQGATLTDIANAAGTSRQRVFQIVNHKPRKEQQQ